MKKKSNQGPKMTWMIELVNKNIKNQLLQLFHIDTDNSLNLIKNESLEMKNTGLTRKTY